MPASDFEKQVRDEPVTDKEWLEFMVFTALHNLKQVAPDHFLVTTVELALRSRPNHDPEKLPSLLKRQAD